MQEKNIYPQKTSKHPAYLMSCAVLAFVLLSIFWFHIMESADFHVTLWTGRDHVRAVNIFSVFEYCGAEMSGGDGMRLPGPLLYWLWKGALLVHDSPVAPHVLSIIMNIAAALVLVGTGRRYWGMGAGLLAGIFYMASPVTNDTMLMLWNPAFMPLFLMLAYRCALDAIVENKPQSIKWFFFYVALAIQLHMSAIILVPAFLLFMPNVISKASRNGQSHWSRPLITSTGLVLLALTPYFIGDMLNGFENSSLLFNQELNKRDDTQSLVNNIAFTIKGILDLLSCADKNLFSAPGATLYSRLAKIFGNIFIWTAWAGAIYSLHFFRAGKKDKQQFKGLLFCTSCFISTIAVYTVFSTKEELRINLRYIPVIVPALGLLAGGAVERTGKILRIKGLGHTHTIFYPIVTTLVIFSITNFTYFRTPSHSYRNSRKVMDFLKTNLGWSIDEISTRTRLLVNPYGTGWIQDYDRFNITDFDAKGYFPGAQNCPGAIVLWASKTRNNPHPLELENFDRKYLRSTIPNLKVLQCYSVAHTHIITYTIPDSKAFTTMSNRYILSPEEKITRRMARIQPKNTACTVKDNTGKKTEKNRKRIYANLDGKIHLLFDFHINAEQIDVTMHSNQLRGTVCNTGFYADGSITRPRLVFEKDEKSQSLLITSQRVGFDGIFTPLTANIDLEPGTYRVSFYANVIPLGVSWNPRPITENVETAGSPMTVVLGKIDIPEK